MILRFAEIHILQSLPNNETSTGLLLAEALQAETNEGDRIRYRDVPSASELHSALDEIAKRLHDEGMTPIVHLGAHGCPDGFGLASGEFVHWEDLKRTATELNVASGINLLLVVSACYGADAVKMIALADPSPVLGCLGPREGIWDSELLEGFTLFYNEMFASADLRSALTAMGGGLPAEGQQFVLWPAEYLFGKAVEQHARECRSDSWLRDRAGRILRELGLEGTRPEAYDEARKRLEAAMLDPELVYELFARRFFMLDRYPDHANRFGSGLEHALNAMRVLGPTT